MANTTLPSMSRGAAPLTSALLGVLGLAACNAILGNEDRYLVEPSCAAGACPSTDAGGQAGTGAGATTTGTGGTATGGSSSGMGGTTGEPDPQSCLLNSDCEPGLVCIFPTCSVSCRFDLDCPPGFRCLDTAAGAACVDAEMSSCDGTCPEGTACLAGHCRTPCTASTVDAGGDAGASGEMEAGTEGGTDAGPLPGTDASTQGGTDAAGVGSPDAAAGAACRSDQVCVEGACVGTGESLDGGVEACDPGDVGCYDRIPQTCGTDGRWRNGAPCPYVCSDGACTGECEPGTSECDGNTEMACSDTGTWVRTTCAIVCVEGACGGLCEPSTMRCDGSTPQTCNALGQWVSEPSCSPGQCDPITYTCKKLIGQACTAREECLSNFCKDGYCCEEACTGTCRSCGLSGSEGTCAAVLGAVDPDSCSGAEICSGSGQCKLADGQQCDTNSQCANSNCNTFYADADGDGYGDAAMSLRICRSTAPAGYVTNNTDCCDSDSRALPGGSNGGTYINDTYGWYASANNCGSFDYTCSGSVMMGSTSGYPTCNATCSNAWCFQEMTCGVVSPVMELDCNLAPNQSYLIYCK
jgi:hypothetical protein